MTNEWNEEAFQLQLAFNHRLKSMSLKDLKFLHKETFAKVKPQLAPRIPPWMPRMVWERRLFLLFACRNYHFSKGHIEFKRFCKQAFNVLAHAFIGNLDSIDKQVKRALNKHGNFTRLRIQAMPEESVDRFLLKLGYEWTDVSLEQRRQLLWEYFNLPAAQTWPKRINRDNQLRNLKKPRNLTLKLREIIKENPTMDWLSFCDVFGERMPSTTHGSFRNARSYLKSQGVALPALKMGRPPWKDDPS